MKVIIADDEKLVRVSLKSMLAEMNLPLEVVGEATNGEEMVSQVIKYAPDVVFVDIQMPKLNGLSGIKAGQTSSPNTQWIILTGFSEFDYAQEAVRLGVANYLLKPVSPEQLNEALQVVIEKNQRFVLSDNKEFEDDMIALFHSLSSLPNEGLDSIFLKSHFKAGLFLIDSYLEVKAKAVRQMKFCLLLRRLKDQLLTNEIRLALFFLPDGQLATISTQGFIPGSKGQEVSENYFTALEQIIEQVNNEEFMITMIQTDDCGSFTELEAQLQQLQSLALLRTVLGIGKKFTIKIINQYSTDKLLMEMGGLFSELSLYYKEKNFASYMKSLRTLAKMVDTIASRESELKRPLMQFIQTAIGCPLQPDREIKSWVKSLEEHAELLLKTQNEKKLLDADIVARVISYINGNYMYEIGISQIAEKLDVTPNYLSTLFHKRTGKGFVKYLTEVRMIRAKELLTDPKLQIQQVAEEVGYYSARYFTKLFTQFEGCYPSEYRKGLKS